MPDPIITRRRFLAGTGLAGFGAFLAACGSPGTASPSPSPEASASAAPSPSPSSEATPAPSLSSVLNFANWPLYIDTDQKDPTKHKTLEDFKAEYGVTVNYSEVINDNYEFFGTIRAPLEAGQDTGWDLMILTNWMAARLVRLGWLERFDHTHMTNFPQNLQAAYTGADFDPNLDYHAVWQAGFTGLGYDSAVTGELTSVNALWDTKWKGRVTYLSEMRDCVTYALNRLGYKNSTVTKEQFDAAIAELKKAKDAGIVRAFTGNEYAEDLVSGNVVLAMAWSGDIFQKQLEKKTLRFSIPDEGGDLWYDCMLIPKGAKNKYTAEVFIDFVYRPEIAAQISAYVNFISPVKGAQEAIKKIDESLASNELIFPTEATYAKVSAFRSLTEDEERYFNDQFSKLIGA